MSERISAEQDFQNDITAVYNWARDWKLAFNESKILHLSFRTGVRALETTYVYVILFVLKTAGIIMSSDLNWSSHYDNILAPKEMHLYNIN